MVYPNPVDETGILNIKFNNEPAGKYKLCLYDNNGSKVYEQDIYYDGNNEKISISLIKLNLTGNYKLVLFSNDDVIIKESINFNK